VETVAAALVRAAAVDAADDVDVPVCEFLSAAW